MYYQKLKKEILKYDHAYYIKAKPLITDSDYDALRRELEMLERGAPELVTPDSPTKTIGAPAQPAFTPVPHSIPMRSLANIMEDGTDTPEDLRVWLAALERKRPMDLMPEGAPWCVQAEPKIDGVSFAARFVEGTFVVAASRGDGHTGEDITQHLRTVSGFPHTLPASVTLEVRGELYLPYAAFEEMNAQRIAEGLTPLANPRNAAAGALRQLDPNEAARRPLAYAIWEVLGPDVGALPTHAACLDYAASLGFCVVAPQRSMVASTIAELMEGIRAEYQVWLQARSKLPYGIDGVVYKINERTVQEAYGERSRSPRWAIAHKFPALQVQTVVEEVVVQVGRSGVLTPVALCAPVWMEGVCVRRATLHNGAELARLDLRVGDTVLLERAGDVVPHIVGVLHELRTPDAVPYHMPHVCPSCGGPITQEEVLRRCTAGHRCPAQAIQYLRHAVGRDALDIEGLGIKQLEFLWESGRVRSLQDLFTLETRNLHERLPLESVAGWGKKSVQKLFASITKRRTVSLARFIYGLGIPNVGKHTSEVLSNYWKNYAEMHRLLNNKELLKNELENIQGIGNTVANSIVNTMCNSEYISYIETLHRYINTD